MYKNIYIFSSFWRQKGMIINEMFDCYSHHQFAASGSCENDDEKFTFLDGVLETGKEPHK